MRLFALFFTLLALLATVVSAWEKEDHEIFDLVTELEVAEGKGTTFYSFLDVPSTATTNEIAKAYRKRSMVLHPDKNPNVKGIHERFARLGVISTILRNKESRKRYDFFYKNGVPKWRGTGYYYSRFRPGLGSVFVFLTMLTSGLQYVIQRINYKRDLERIELIVSKAKSAAWGPKLVPVSGRRKVRINLGDAHDEDGSIVGSKHVDMIVEDSHVYLLEPTGEKHLIDASTATRPSIGNTWFLALIQSLVQKFTGKNSSHTTETASSLGAHDKKGAVAPDVDSDDASSSDGPGSDASTSRHGEGQDKTAAGARMGPTVKAGGMRRKVRRR
ncbi:hypothetical protein M413DRAFT_441171 [Hebeloma cylindrosporum]|uniref:J domain-containing protein n=1 Tax=Hebeloma cylindrosporum TaxID=76867 RepID=A0A0C3CPU6_HEBCY|nr:hypothetical protein M413DRAFT_441171 [Hebeloma cylindrosporum h7]